MPHYKEREGLQRDSSVLSTVLIQVVQLMLHLPNT